MPETRVWIDTTERGWRLSAELPLNRLELAFGHALAEQPAQALSAHGAALADYLLQHVGARSASGSWQVLRPQLRVRDDGAAELLAEFELVAPSPQAVRAGTLLFDAITHEVRTHRVQVFLRNDWASGRVGGTPQLLGELNSTQRQVEVQLDAARLGAGLRTLFADGAKHILEGTDHLLFLLLLVLVAPLTVQAGRWGDARTPIAALRRTVWIVSAFTLGHTVTLVLGSTGVFDPPSQAVEVAVALTIAVTAVHVWRPLFGSAEAAVAGVFGAVHGLAFSASLSGASLTPAQHAWALLGFNLGIEAMQIAMLLLVAPPLVMLARRRESAHGQVRQLLSVLALLAAGWWTVDRMAWLEGPPAPQRSTSSARSSPPSVIEIIACAATAGLG